MAGRKFGPPPTVITEFNITWRNWLYLLYQKIYVRPYYVFIQAIDGIGDGNASNTMQEGLIGISPVILAPDNKTTSQNFTSAIPLDWVEGSNLEFAITFANTQAQTGITGIVTQLDYSSTAIGEDLTAGLSTLTLTSTLPNNVAANILHIVTFTVTPVVGSKPGKQFQFEINRIGGDSLDTCVGDVGYKLIVFKYQGFINHE